MVTRGKSPTMLAYLAGILDGEGHIGIDKTISGVQRHRNPRYQTQVTVVSSSRALIEWLSSELGGSITVRRREQSHHKQTWRWKVGSESAADICRAVLPYLMVKEAQARLIIEYADTVQTYAKGGHRLMPTEEVEKRESIYQRLKLAIDDRRHPQRLTEGAPDA